MTKYLFGSNYCGTPIEKSFETEDEAFEYSNAGTDGPDILPIWKKIGDYWYSHNWQTDTWVKDEHMTFTHWLRTRIETVTVKRKSFSFATAPIQTTAAGAQLTAFKQVLDFYTKHFIPQ